MKTGFILYLMDSSNGDVKFDPTKTVKRLKDRFDSTKIVDVASNSFDLVNAWNQLMDKGVDRIIITIGKMVNESKVIISSREIRMSEFDITAYRNGASIH